MQYSCRYWWKFEIQIPGIRKCSILVDIGGKFEIPGIRKCSILVDIGGKFEIQILENAVFL